MAKKQKRHSGSYAKKRNLSSTQVKALLNAHSNKRNNLLIRVLFELGCTVSELVNIKVEDINTNSIRVGKQKRSVELSIELREEIQDYLKAFPSSGFLFSTRQSPKIDVRRVQQLVRIYVKHKPTELRHARIAELAKENGIKELKNICGLKGLKIKSILKNDEIQRLQKNISNKEHHIAFNLLLETGCLISELVEFKVEDIKENSVIVGKAKRNVSISDKLVSEINSFVRGKNGNEPLFKTRQSNKISDKRVFQILKNYGNAEGINLNPRIIRNTKFASMLQAGENKSKIELELGIKRLEFGSYGLLNQNE
jgi:integrase